AEIAGVGNAPGAAISHAPVPTSDQAAFNAMVAAAVGFDFEGGRLDVSTHPFCEGIGPGSTRMTRRCLDDYFADSLDAHLLDTAHRCDLDRRLRAGDLPIAELPGAWNERVRQDLGLDVPDDRRGCLQDIHWSMGAVGYFPTYTLGNLYAAQLWEAITRDVPD